MEIGDVINLLDTKRKIAPNGQEYWMARDLMAILGYSEWRNFKGVIEAAKVACEGSGIGSAHHFVDTTEGMTGGKGAQIQRENLYLSRYACYLIAMNGDSGKPEIATAQTYFAIQTRKQERFELLTDEEKRIELRERVKLANRHLGGAAKVAGVQDFADFYAAGYRGLYGGLGLLQIKAHKGIPAKDDLLDRAGRAELAANEFKATQTEQRLSREKVRGHGSATRVHHEVGKEVRAAIARIGGTMPENLPAEESVKKLKARRKTIAKSSKELLP
jgi:DNA-damage-inducible protein D